MDLIARFAPLMAEALHYAELSSDPLLPLEEIQARLISLADLERSQPMLTREGGLENMTEDRLRQLEDARFAVYAFVDEKLLNAHRPDAGCWMPLSLQCHYFATTEAGWQFFTKLDDLLYALGIREDLEYPRNLADRLEDAGRRLTEVPDELKIFALCLLYGFKGRLFDQDELLLSIRQICVQLLARKEQNAVLPHTVPSTPTKGRLRDLLEAVSYVLVPVAVTLAFWFFCADILANIPAKSF